MELVFKLYKKVLDECLREVVDIGKIQGFRLGRGTFDVVFVLRTLTAKFRAKNKLFFIFIDLEKGFWLVALREVVRLL